MNAQLKRFIVVSLSTADSSGYDRHTMQQLLRVVEPSSPDTRYVNYLGMAAYFLTSAQTFSVVERLISDLENLRDTDSQFATLRIGLAEGELIADFDEAGVLRTESMLPLGGAVNEAAWCGREPNKYKTILLTLREKILREATKTSSR
ncbi:MAG: hypothetical protein EBS05_08480 [Proteobacteria bacterium]|nr:hypothetical protein [Pseudomonadota bacterium]